MAIRKYKPTTSSRRGASVSDFDTITKTRPEKSLTGALTRSSGRNGHGRITSYHRGGGPKRRFRHVDFRRIKDDVPATVAAVEYDPNRSAPTSTRGRRRQEAIRFSGSLLRLA